MIETILIISAYCMGMAYLFQSLLKPVYEWADSQDGWRRIILKPVILCPICFSSFWGTLVFISLNEFYFERWLICCIASIFVNCLFYEKVMKEWI
jgi:hypothetical protein